MNKALYKFAVTAIDNSFHKRTVPLLWPTLTIHVAGQRIFGGVRSLLDCNAADAAIVGS